MGLQQLVEAIVEIARGAPESDVVRVASIAEGVGLIRIQPVPGTPFDPQAHRVVDTVTDHGSNHSPSTIVRVVRDGWALAGDVVQPADVVVNS